MGDDTGETDDDRTPGSDCSER